MTDIDKTIKHEIKTTELPLATKLYQESAQSLNNLEVIRIRGRNLVQFHFAVEDPKTIDDFRTGKDGIQQYETCRKMLARMMDIEMQKAVQAEHDNRGNRG